MLKLTPDHFVDYTNVRLNDSYYLGTYVLIHVIRHRDAGLGIFYQFHGHIDTLEQALGINTTQYKATLVQGFRTLGTGADAHGRERMALTGEETALLRQGAGVGDDTEGVHLEAVVVVKAQGLMLDDAFIQLETACFQALLGARVATVKNGHIIFLCHLIDCSEQ